MQRQSPPNTPRKDCILRSTGVDPNFGFFGMMLYSVFIFVLSDLEQLLSRGRVELVALIRCSSWGLFHGKLLYAVSLYLAGSDGSMRKTEVRKLITRPFFNKSVPPTDKNNQ